MSLAELLNSDLKHCDLDTAEKIVKGYDDTIHKFLDENMGIYEDFLKAEQESDYSLAEYLWYGYWDEVVNYLQKSE